MILLLHGVAGGWDEVLIAVAAFGVLWVAVKLAGRKPNNDEDEDENTALDAEAADMDVDVDADKPKQPVHPVRRK